MQLARIIGFFGLRRKGSNLARHARQHHSRSARAAPPTARPSVIRIGSEDGRDFPQLESGNLRSTQWTSSHTSQEEEDTRFMLEQSFHHHRKVPTTRDHERARRLSLLFRSESTIMDRAQAAGLVDQNVEVEGERPTKTTFKVKKSKVAKTASSTAAEVSSKSKKKAKKSAKSKKSKKHTKSKDKDEHAERFSFNSDKIGSYELDVDAETAMQRMEAARQARSDELLRSHTPMQFLFFGGCPDDVNLAHLEVDSRQRRTCAATGLRPSPVTTSIHVRPTLVRDMPPLFEPTFETFTPAQFSFGPTKH
ncbi:TPA: hypothetical protein N0F65_002731 [Lagenidium giganteum]|uniref:Uncharacterized protein n=1 Tax=Lagenidium giganteum TaxID=4803 RepID=A0AAV2Z0L9_9STRA|nr:TPA: hypothetical protein N0F65_002731 [Lagenidium giganteum]